MMRTKLAIFEIYIGLNNIENIYILLIILVNMETLSYARKKYIKIHFDSSFFFYVLLYLISIHLNAN